MPPLHRRAFVVAAAFVLAGCSTGQPGGSPLPTATPDSPPSPALASAVPSDVLAECPNFVEVVETGPMPGDDGTEEGPVAREQERIRGDVDAAGAYGAKHPDEFASVRFENGPRVRLVIGFTAHIEEHCAALREILEYPDEFEIIRQPATEAQLMATMDDISERYRSVLRGIGLGAGRLDLWLRADGEPVAAEVLATYGDLVTITVGLLPYPDRFAGDASCGLAGPILSDTPFRVTAVLNPDLVRPGADFGGSATISNAGSTVASIESGASVVAIAFRKGSNVPVGFWTGGRDAMGFGATLAPGESVDLPILGGTASCDPALGYAVPPGRYEVRVLVDYLTSHDNAPTDVGFLLSEPVPLTIAP